MPTGDGSVRSVVRHPGISGCGGFTYIWLLFAIALLGLLLSVAGTLWHTTSVRESEKELLFIGAQYQRAIASYHELSFNGVQNYPKSINDLLEDRRFPMPVRHLRRQYADPIGRGDWELIRLRGGIIGVYSPSLGTPLKIANFGSCCSDFQSAKTYADWKFIELGGAALIAQGKAEFTGLPGGDGSTAANPAEHQPGSDMKTLQAEYKAMREEYRAWLADVRAKIAATFRASGRIP